MKKTAGSMETASREGRVTCPVCKGAYEAPPGRTGKAACPYCRDKKPLRGFNTFADRHPDLLKEWDPIANYLLISPYEILEKHRGQVYWKCPKCEEIYHMTPAKRLEYQERSQQSCPFCKGRRQKKIYF